MEIKEMAMYIIVFGILLLLMAFTGDLQRLREQERRGQVIGYYLKPGY